MATTSEIKPNNNEASICNITNDEDEASYTYAYRLVNSCTLPMVMKATIKMGVLQLIHDHGSPSGLSALDIATRINIPNPNAPAMLDRMLRLLATYLVVKCTTVSATDGGVERRYSPSRVTKSKLDEAVIEGGIPFNIVHGMSLYEYESIDSRFNEDFNNAMNQNTTFTINKILEKYKGFKNIQQLVDVGGGVGQSLRVITSKYPSIKGINFDLPHVIQNAPPCPGVEHVSGDMFEFIPQGDAIFIKWVLFNWSDKHCLKLLENCYKALPKNGKVIVVEEMLANEVESTNSSQAITQMDVLMMTVPGGKVRNKQQFEAMAKAAGFSNVNFDCCAYNFWVMEFYK
ncbi:Caffeic acid 3-O-methyltransferase [Bienertia sinuspersici]